MELIEQTKRLIDAAQNILVATGAGISTGAGIPDFSSEDGLYEAVKKKFNLSNPRLVFDINYFVNNPAMFYEFAPELANEYSPTIAHKYIAELEKNHKVVVLTQNIDGLHRKAGSTTVIDAHGTIAEAYCLQCGYQDKNPSYNGEVLYCEQCGGLMKPSVVFYSEQLPASFYKFYENWKEYNFDLMLVIGTGLEVYPVAGLVHRISKEVKNTIYITKKGSNTLKPIIRVQEDIQQFFKKLKKIKNLNY